MNWWLPKFVGTAHPCLWVGPTKRRRFCPHFIFLERKDTARSKENKRESHQPESKFCGFALLSSASLKTPSLLSDLFAMTKQQANWSPYDNNGGYFLFLPHSLCSVLMLLLSVPVMNQWRTLYRSCVAIAGADYCVIAADTRLSTGYNILTRDYSKICKLYVNLLSNLTFFWNLNS